MSRIISSDNRKSRGKVKCFGCLEIISKNIIYERQTVTDEDRIWSINKCPECIKYCNKCSGYACEECYEGNIGILRKECEV